MKKAMLFSLLFSVIILSCQYDCIKATSSLKFIKFTNTETETIIVRRFQKQSGFAKLVDTTLLNRFNSNYQVDNDTLEIIHSYGIDEGLTSTFDYEIVMPKINRLYRITTIEEDPQSMNTGLSCNKLACVNMIQSYQLDGQLITGTGYRNTFTMIK